ncbi:MAG: FtsH protease activity modulator HflK [Chromatiales bacterium]|nr:FtsH protease activity modulator HflK [Chromatiales bacterium]
MAWNEPGSGKKDPWGGSGGDQGPPDLDEVVRKLQEKMGNVFGGKGGKSGGSGSSGGGGNPINTLGFKVAVGVLLIVWLFSGVYIVDEGKRGVVLRFGEFVDSTTPGPHWHIPSPIETVEIVDVEQQRYVEVGYRSGGRRQAEGSVPREALMLTEDENIVDVQLAVQYRIKNARDYLFNVIDPDLVLRQATESAIREVVGKSKMDFLLTQGRSEIVADTKDVLQRTLDTYESGLQVISVNMQKARPPQEVKAAFDDAIKAREDEQRQKNEAEAYASEVLPKARGGAARQLEDANAYRSQVVAQAEGESARFTKLLTEYEKAPAVTRERLYLEAIESVMGSTNKVVMDAKGGNNLLYLPLDRLMQGERKSIGSLPTAGFSGSPSASDSVTDSQRREVTRGRSPR